MRRKNKTSVADARTGAQRDLELLSRPIEVVNGDLTPEEAARRFAWLLWPAPQSFKDIHPTQTPGVYAFRLEKVGCWYRLQKTTHGGRTGWGVFWTPYRWW